MADNFKQYLSRHLSRISLRTALIGLFIAVLLAVGVVYFTSRSTPTVEAKAAPYAARIEQVEGGVGKASALENRSNTELDWEEVNRNTPLVAGDRVYAREGSTATVAFTGHNSARLDSNSALDVLTLAEQRTQLALRNGSALFDVGELADNELFEVATTNGAVDFTEPGLYQVGIGDDGNAWVAVLSGLAQVVGLGGSGEISKGEIFNFAAQAAAEAVTSKLAPDYAGEIVNDYYSHRYPKKYDGRYRNYEAYLDDPDYYDSYDDSVSYDYLSSYDVPGIYDLDDYGDWQDFNDYGRCWVPRVDAGWVPYRNGYWDSDNIYGPTWISQETWGWTPYHYGRWACVNNAQWIWVPDRVRYRPAYAPALVAFVPFTQVNQIGWVPLAPGEPYVARYYDTNFQPHYYASPEVVREVVTVQRTYINTRYSQAITVVPFQQFNNYVEPQVITQVNPQYIAQARPTVEPYAIDGFRNMALRGENPRRKFKMERAITQQIFDRPVVTSAEPANLPGRGNMISKLHVATLPDKQKRQKIKIQDSGQVVTAQQNGQPQAMRNRGNSAVIAQERQQRMAELSTQAAQGDRSAKRELKQMRREQRDVGNGGQPPAMTHSPTPGAQQPTAGQPLPKNERKAQRQLERQQMERAQMNQPVQQPRQERQMMKQQRRAERQQQVVQPPQMNNERQMRKAQRQQQRPPQIDQQQVMRQQQAQQQQAHQQMKMQRRQQEQQMIQRQQQVQQQQMQQQQRQMMKQQRRAEQQAAPPRPQVVMPQPRKPVEMKGPPVNQGAPAQGNQKGGRKKP